MLNNDRREAILHFDPNCAETRQNSEAEMRYILCATLDLRAHFFF
jgi:hypothetical protein